MPHPEDITWQMLAPAPVRGDRPACEIMRSVVGSEAVGRLLASASDADEPILLCVNDSHRATHTRLTLEALADVVARQPERPRFRAIVATGTHRFSQRNRQEFERATFADCGLRIEEVCWHDADDCSQLVEIAGVRMHRSLAASKYLLPIGSVEPHYFAGVTGAHKTVTIGCMAREDIERNHAGALAPASGILRLAGNPVFDHIAEVVRALQASGKTIVAINQIIRGEALVSAVAGDPITVLDTLLPAVRSIYLRQVPEPADVLRLKVPPPLGANLYQADKALKNNHQAVRDGGGILLEADCPEGIGPDDFMNLLRQGADYKTVLRCVERKGYRLGDHKAVKLRQLTDPNCRGVRIALLSCHVSPSDAATAGMNVFGQVEPALAWLAETVWGPLERGLTIEDAGHLCVVARSLLP